MSTKYSRELRELDIPALRIRLDEASKELTDIRFRLATRQSENTAQINQVKRQIARIKTILSEREGEA